MKNTILEVQKYFINKITACEFDLEKLEIISDQRVDFHIIIDGFKFNFCINPKMQYFCFFGGFMNINISNDRLNNLLDLIESKRQDAKLQKIESLKAELEELQSA